MTKHTKWHVQRRLRSARASSICPPWIAKDPSFLHADSEDWSGWADTQADLSLHWAHMPFCWLCHALAYYSGWYEYKRFIYQLLFIHDYRRMSKKNPMASILQGLITFLSLDQGVNRYVSLYENIVFFSFWVSIEVVYLCLIISEKKVCCQKVMEIGAWFW